MLPEIPWPLVPPLPDTALVARIQGRDLGAFESGQARSAYIWTTLIAETAVLQDALWGMAARKHPDYPWMAAGFVPIPEGLTVPDAIERRNDFFFGLCLFPPLQTGDEPQFVPPLVVAGRPIPVLSVPAEFSPHAPPGGPPDPHGAAMGTAACWAEAKPGGSNPTNLQGTGILTAAHVAVEATARPGMTPSTAHAVTGFAIDAAVMSPSPRPTSASQLAVCPAVAVGTNVDVFPRAGGSPTATILMTFQPSNYIGKLCPHRMVIDTSFLRGDSGSLARDASPPHDAVGLYIGAIRPKGSPARGACQLLEQVVAELDIDLYL